MDEYYFLFALGFLWSVFAVVQDMKTTEVSNWLNFSLIGFGLGYRAFYALEQSHFMFFLSGVAGFFAFFLLAYGFYYARAFAGGDAKLLMGFGILLPYGDFFELISWGTLFLFALFFWGVLYSLIYSFLIVLRKKRQFGREFSMAGKRNLWIMVVIFFLSVLLAFFVLSYGVFTFVFLGSIFVLYLYLLALDRCMVEGVSPWKLQEGDWMIKDVRVGGRMIRKRVDGLSLEEIRFLQKMKKSVLIKRGIPFTPAFILGLITVAVFSALSLQDLLFSLV